VGTFAVVWAGTFNGAKRRLYDGAGHLVANGTYGLHIVSVADPTSPVEVGTYP
jgi:hypothetical protein